MRSSRRIPPFAATAAAVAMTGLGVVTVPAVAAAEFTPFISEIHYDNVGADEGEAVEIEAPAGFDLTGWKIVRYNGNVADAAVVYTSPGTINGTSENLSGTVPAAGVVVIEYAQNGLQNGPRDGIALVGPDGQAVELISYDGVFAASNGPAAGKTSADIGVKEPSSTPIGHSLQKVDGRWTGPLPNTFGVRNGSGGGDPDPTPTPTSDPGQVPIAEIQGTGASTPYEGQTVTTSGVVTATYPTGGFNGYYIQTPGTGGDSDMSERTASDAIFVFSSAALPRIGDHVQVTGKVSEYFGLTEITVPASGLTILDKPAEAVKPVQFVLPRDEATREKFEGMLVQPTGAYTVSDTYNLGGWGNNAFGSITLAAGDTPLRQPTDAARPGAGADAVTADNQARRVVLDDGQSARTPSSGQVPYLTRTTPVRTGASVAFPAPVIFDYRNDEWKFQPTGPLPGGASDAVTFQDTRTKAPEPVGGDVRLATFNVLNYFTTLGVDLPGCKAYTDRAGNPISVSGGCDARGAWDRQNLDRQQGKIVSAINSLDADVVALEEVENSAKFNKDRDDALAKLVDALNADAGPGTWDYAKSPEKQPDLQDQDVIRNAFIYRPAAVTPVGSSTILTDSPAFHNAREPLAQEFAAVNGGKRFLAITNHFKSKGCGGTTDPGDGQGCWTPDRVKQAQALAGFADALVAKTGTRAVFLFGDFNAYTQEDPMQVLYTAGYTDLNAEFAKKHTYVFDETVGSLDHILGNAAALTSVRGVDVWNINSVESVLTEYSRHNYFAGDLFEPATPYRSSDHDPILVGVQSLPACTKTIGGKHSGPLTVSSGITCLDGATVSGGVTVRPGAGLFTTGSRISGPITASQAGQVALLRTTISGPVTITGSGEVTLDGLTISGPVRLNDNRAPVVAGNRISGPLSCTGNSPAPINNDRPNTVSGPKTGQCSGL
ncbi:ExeM/NucH family extracellular endonuclease [Sphaerimonospora cavernae]|uniref:ExeM/NucH family extracellular endonuclease n=1 Tax=Sphaerimonospora cavernae TaxID=1740611 RepID=A0ABV6U3J3_9ACTN